MDEQTPQPVTASRGGKNEKTSGGVKVRPEAIRIRKDNLFANARSVFPEEPLDSLKNSIKDLGLLKALTVERDQNSPDEFILIAGERRHIAISALKAEGGLCRCTETGETLPVTEVYDFVDVKVVKPKDDLERLQIMIAENAEHSQVPDWDYFQFALKLDGQVDQQGEKKYTRKDLCQVFNASAAWVSHTLSLAKLPQKVLTSLKDGTLPRTAAVQLLSAKDDRIEEVLKYAEGIILRTAREELAKAEEDSTSANLDLEMAQEGQAHAESVGDRITMRVWAKRGGEAKKRITGAQHRQEKATKTLTEPTIITDESIKQTFEENPDTLKPGVAPKGRSPKRMREKVNNLKKLLDAVQDAAYIVNEETGRKYPVDDLHLLIAASEQWFGKKPLDPFCLLDEEYAAREERKGRAA